MPLPVSFLFFYRGLFFLRPTSASQFVQVLPGTTISAPITPFAYVQDFCQLYWYLLVLVLFKYHFIPVSLYPCLLVPHILGLYNDSTQIVH